MPRVQAVVPPEALGDQEGLAALLDSVQAEYEEIDRTLAALRDETGDWGGWYQAEAVAFVTLEELADPQALAAALAPLQSDATRFELLWAQARRTLERLDAYRLSRASPAQLSALLRRERDLERIAFLVEFLRSLHSAADSFEAIELPPAHIHDYLEHLYRMRDWAEMGRLVRLLEATVARFLGAREGE